MYAYEKYRPTVFTEEGSKKQNIIRSRVENSDQKLFTLEDLMSGCFGDGFETIAVIDYLVEIGFLVMIAKGTVSNYDVYRKR